MVSVLLMEKLDLFIGCHHKKVTVFDEKELYDRNGGGNGNGNGNGYTNGGNNSNNDNGNGNTNLSTNYENYRKR